MFAIFLLTLVVVAQSVPLQNSTYDLSQFDEVHDQRQNGTENWRVNLEKIVLIWSSPTNLPAAALLIDPSLLEQIDQSEATTKIPEPANKTDNGGSTKRRFRLPGFLRPFVRRRTQH